MKFRPLHDRVVVKRLEEETKTTGGIIIPDTAKEKPQQGKVVAVGPGGRDEAGKVTPLDVKAGDVVLFGKWSGTEVKIDGEDLLIMKESDILGIISSGSSSAKATSSVSSMAPPRQKPPNRSALSPKLPNLFRSCHTWPLKT